jgi:hypothetical protein
MSNTIINTGLNAWQRVREGGHWHDWCDIGAAVLEGRKHAMAASHSNEPRGNKYSQAFSAWLIDYPTFGDGEGCLGKSLRSRLLACMENLTAINEWLETLPLKKRLSLNNPETVFRNWKASTKEPKQTDAPKKSSLKEEIVRLQDEADKANLYARRLEEESKLTFNIFKNEPQFIAEELFSQTARLPANERAKHVEDIARSLMRLAKDLRATLPKKPRKEKTADLLDAFNSTAN